MHWLIYLSNKYFLDAPNTVGNVSEQDEPARRTLKIRRPQQALDRDPHMWRQVGLALSAMGGTQSLLPRDLEIPQG